jgi:aminoglycoside/choline kinase family phosphotransferase
VLEDARRDVDPAIEARMLARYVASTGSDERFERAYWALAAQRNTRILGVFTRLWKRDGKPGYRKFQPRMWGLLERDLEQPGLEEVRDWFDREVPEELRRAPWEGEVA